jgi:hypothetical protein
MAAKALLLLAAAAHAFITPVRRLRPMQPLQAIPMDAIEVTTQTLAANSALTSTADELAGSLFGASLLPWLAMLYWLKHPKTQAPRGVCFGLTYLLAFVFGSIPAAIGAGALYGASLADADWLHGAAESLLAATNCVVVLGFRDALAGKDDPDRLQTAATYWAGFAILSCFVVMGGNLMTMDAAAHAPWLNGIGNIDNVNDPINALSIPTWIIHTSSLVEWLVAMGLAWRYADVIGKEEWKGVTWGMLPLHTSGIVACCYHLFYNAPELSWCVALQAGCTCLGNTTMAYAMYRLAVASGWTLSDGRSDAEALYARWVLREDVEAVETETPSLVTAAPSSTTASLLGWEDLGDAWALDSDAFFLGKLLALSAFLAYVVKYAPPLIPGSIVDGWAGAGDGVHSGAAALVIVVPTLLNCAKWYQRSQEGAEFVGDI